MNLIFNLGKNVNSEVYEREASPVKSAKDNLLVVILPPLITAFGAMGTEIIKYFVSTAEYRTFIILPSGQPNKTSTVLIYLFLFSGIVSGILLLDRIIAMVNHAYKKNYLFQKSLLVEYVIAMCIVIFCISKVISCVDFIERVDDDYLEIDEFRVEEPPYQEMINNIHFENIKINQVETIWESILNSILGTHSSDPDNLIKEFYGTDILPEVNENFKENVNDHNDFSSWTQELLFLKNKFYLSAMRCDAEIDSKEWFYQTGRVADNVADLLTQNEGSLKDVLFYSYMAAYYYNESIAHQENPADNSYTYYKIALVYLNLYETYNTQYEGEGYCERILPVALQYLEKAGSEFYIEDADKDINEFLTNYEYYYTYALFSFIDQYGSESESNKQLCKKYAESYINFPNADKEYIKKYMDFLMN